MSEIVSVKVTGLDEVQRKLEQLPRKVAKRIFRQVLRTAAEIWRKEMKETAPKLGEVRLSTKSEYVRVPGDLANHIMTRTVIKGEDLEASANVGPVRRVFWAMFLEFGTRRMKAQPFIRRAFESKADAVLAKFTEEAKRVLDEEVSRV